MGNIYENKIKNNKPKRNSHYHQGYVPERYCSKLFQSVKGEPIIYRSGLELQFIQFCENNNKIKKWASEPISIKYTCRLDEKEHDYYPDYVIETTEGEKIIVEIKPYNQTIKPGPLDSRWLKESWIKNCDKWKAANDFAHKNNSKFIIVTEKFFE